MNIEMKPEKSCVGSTIGNEVCLQGKYTFGYTPYRPGENIKRGLDQLGLSTRTRNALARAGFDSVEELDGLTDGDIIFQTRNFSVTRCQELRRKVEEYKKTRKSL